MPRPGNGRSDQRSLQELWSELSEEATTLIRKEVELARVEVKESASKLTRAATMFTSAGVVAFLAAQALSVALGFGLATVLPPGVAALVIGVMYLFIAGAMAAVAKRRVAGLSGPQETMRTIKDDVRVAKESLSHGAGSEPGYDRPWASTRS